MLILEVFREAGPRSGQSRRRLATLDGSIACRRLFVCCLVAMYILRVNSEAMLAVIVVILVFIFIRHLDHAYAGLSVLLLLLLLLLLE